MIPILSYLFTLSIHFKHFDKCLESYFHPFVDQARRIGDTEKRKCFLSQVKVNEEIVIAVQSDDWEIET